MFCSKCILKHTALKHEVINCSPKGKEWRVQITIHNNCSFSFLVMEMKRMVQEMITEVEVLE